MRRRSLVGVLIWACTPFCVARAADSPAPVGHLATGADSSQPSPASSTLSVTVQGTRPPPRSASDKTIPHDVIAAAPHRTGADTLVAVPGIFLTQHSGEGKAYQIFFRGFDAVHGQDPFALLDQQDEFQTRYTGGTVLHFYLGVVLSGGEPTLLPGLRRLIHAVPARGFKVKLDTNGTRPERSEKRRAPNRSAVARWGEAVSP